MNGAAEGTVCEAADDDGIERRSMTPEDVEDARKQLMLMRESYEKQKHDDEPPFFTSYIVEMRVGPPEGYQIGDIYLKLELANEAKALEDRVNSCGTGKRGLRKRKSILQSALSRRYREAGFLSWLGSLFGPSQTYEERIEQSTEEYKRQKKIVDLIVEEVKKCETDFRDFREIKERGAADSSLNAGKRCISVAARVREMTGYLSEYQKKCFDAYTTTSVLHAYSGRIAGEIHRTEQGTISNEFRLLRDADQPL